MERNDPHYNIIRDSMDELQDYLISKEQDNYLNINISNYKPYKHVATAPHYQSYYAGGNQQLQTQPTMNHEYHPSFRNQYQNIHNTTQGKPHQNTQNAPHDKKMYLSEDRRKTSHNSISPSFLPSSPMNVSSLIPKPHHKMAKIPTTAHSTTGEHHRPSQPHNYNSLSLMERASNSAIVSSRKIEILHTNTTLPSHTQTHPHSHIQPLAPTNNPPVVGAGTGFGFQYNPHQQHHMNPMLSNPLYCPPQLAQTPSRETNSIDGSYFSSRNLSPKTTNKFPRDIFALQAKKNIH
jgi:hypothetical protein